MNFQPILLTILAGSIALLDMSALAQSKPATPPAKTPAKAASAKETAKKPTSKDAPVVASTVIETEKSKSVYIVPMGIEDKGQFGLDIHPQVYEQIAKDITEKRPDIVVFVLNSADLSSVRYLGDDPRMLGLFDDDGIRKMTRDLKEVIEKVGAESIMIVRDAVGYSVLLGLSWPNMYMTDSARLMGLERIQERTKAEDPEVYAKFREAMIGICNGFLISGGYDPNIGMAMMREDKMLSATFKGREIVWSDDAKGTWVVDGSKEKITAHFNSEMAEDLGLSDGTVSDDGATMIEDLMYLRGTRNYERLPQDGEILVRQYIDGWRKGLEDCVKSYPKYQEALGEAQGKDEKKNLSKAKGILEKVLSILKKYPAVAIRLNQQFGISRLEIETELLTLKDRIRGLGKSTAPPSGGRGKGGGGGLGVGSNITDSQ